LQDVDLRGNLLKFSGQLHMESKDYQKAVKFYQQALLDLPKSEIQDAIQSFVCALMKLKQGDKALEVLRQNVSDNPSNARAWFMLGQALQDLDKVASLFSLLMIRTQRQ
jgi:tetratricopeptide (TPR) repeat protein